MPAPPKDKAREVAQSVSRHDTDIAGIRVSPHRLGWMSGFVLTFVVATARRIFA